MGNTYQFVSGIAQLTIDNLASGDPQSQAPEASLALPDGVNDQDVWFAQSGSDLQVDLLGTTDQVTIQNWFGSNAGSDLAQILTKDGFVAQTSDINNLVSAVANYQISDPDFSPAGLTSAMPNDPGLQAAVNAAWHH